MAYTTRIDKTIFIHDGDYHGDIVIMESETNREVKIPFVHLTSFIAEHIRQEKITELENLSTDEILKRAGLER